jgi:hypothetical protein
MRPTKRLTALVSERSTVRMIDELSINSHARVTGPFWENRTGRTRSLHFPAATILALVAFEVLAACCCGTVAKRRLIFQPGKRGSDLLRCLDEMKRRYESARGCRGSSSLNPLIVVRREVQQSSLGKLICVLRKAATTFGMRFQEVRIHGKPHSTTNSVLHSRIYDGRRRVRLNCG